MELDEFKKMDLQQMYAGFEPDGNRQIHLKMKNKAIESFRAMYSRTFATGTAKAVRYFNKSEEGKTYFNKFDVITQLGTAEPIKQTYYVHFPVKVNWEIGVGRVKPHWVNSGFTFKEAINLNTGRAVLKDFTTKNDLKYTAWAKLDFEQLDNNGNYKYKRFKKYDLESQLVRYAFRELENPQLLQRLVRSLQRGNLHPVTVAMSDGSERRVLIEANPVYKSINIYDQNRTRLRNIEFLSDAAIHSIFHQVEQGNPQKIDETVQQINRGKELQGQKPGMTTGKNPKNVVKPPKVARENAQETVADNLPPVSAENQQKTDIEKPAILAAEQAQETVVEIPLTTSEDNIQKVDPGSQTVLTPEPVEPGSENSLTLPVEDKQKIGAEKSSKLASEKMPKESKKRLSKMTPATPLQPGEAAKRGRPRKQGGKIGSRV